MTGRTRSGRILHGPDGSVKPFTGRPEPEEDPLAAVEREAFARGRKQGFDEGARQAGAELAQAVEQVRQELARTLERLAELDRERERRSAELVAEIALAAASRIVREKIDAGDPLAVRALAEAVEKLPSSVELEVRLHPEDLEAVGERLSGTPSAERLRLVADAAVSRGGCIVESEAGSIDATLETASASVREAVEGEADTR